MELQSTVDVQMPFRLLQYMMEIWRNYLRSEGETDTVGKGFKLPAIVPIVLYNGHGPWYASTSFRESIEYEQWFNDELLDFKYILINIHEYSDEKLKELSNLIGVVFLLDRQTEQLAMKDQMKRASNILERLPKEQFAVFKSWLEMMAFRKGMEKGIQEGEEKARLEIATRMLERDMTVEVIVKVTDITLDEVKKLKQNK